MEINFSEKFQSDNISEKSHLFSHNYSTSQKTVMLLQDFILGDILNVSFQVLQIGEWKRYVHPDYLSALGSF